ncbi:MAG: peptidoglycan-binding domain-containing protein [Bacillota bacterium]
MKALKKGSSGKEVKLLQGWLNVLGHYDGKIDGHYGMLTAEAVKGYQACHGLKVDCCAGAITQKNMGFMPVKDPKIVVLRIPFSKIITASVLLKDKQKYSVGSLAKAFGMNVVVNGGFFDRRTLQNVTDLIVDGVLNNGGNYTDKGLAFGNDFQKYGIYPSTTADNKGKPVDFMGGVPALIQGGKKAVDMKGIPQSIYTQITRRIGTGVWEDAFCIMLSLNNCSLEAMVQEGLNQGLIFLKGNDGGGSQSVYFGTDTIIPTDGRAIPSGEGLLVRKEV